ncbi:MAG: hypothetical protein KBG48_35315 [Kofleriaceae bacterium]|jgi:hypothetical protein|nr:hypothetical protein [Kofleriaceae bacterium]MBP9172683.1 hypothetical protein [Kofleriaceae bacterium]MBP9862093.1 hypothetical protein [Kofleriaceae bacterium]
MRAAHALLTLGAVAAVGCASARQPGELDAAAEVDGAVIDGAVIDAAVIDGAVIDGAVIDGAVIDAAAIDARPIDAPPPIDARPIDAPPPIDARPIDATPIDAPCTPTWQNLLVNGNFDSATVPPWTQTSAIITASPPFAPRTAPNAARFGAGNNANDVLVQTVTVPATATGLRLRGYECHVTEDVITDADEFTVTVETPAGVVLEVLREITNSDVAPICLWQSFTWTATAAHPGQSVVLKLRGRTNLAFLTRFVVDDLAFEALACP